MASAHTQPARGMRDFLPDDVRRREHVIGVVARRLRALRLRAARDARRREHRDAARQVRRGGQPAHLQDPEARRARGRAAEADLALRYDLTVPLARVVASTRQSCRGSSSATRSSRSGAPTARHAGRFREFYQCDVDALGSTSPVVEAELCAAVSRRARARSGFADFTIRLNHRPRADVRCSTRAGVPSALHGSALVALDKLDKIGADGRAAGARGTRRGARTRPTRCSASSRGVEAGGGRRRAVPSVPRALLRRVRRRPAGPPAVDEPAARSCEPARRRRSAAGRIRLDPSLARGLSYYTGAIMEIAVPDLAGSLGGGGRYDNLVGMFLGRDVPACGFSLGLERILVVMGERGMFPPSWRRAPADVMVDASWTDELRGEALRLARELRAAGLRVRGVSRSADKIGKQFKYAVGRDVPFVAMLGEDERGARRGDGQGPATRQQDADDHGRRRRPDRAARPQEAREAERG